MGNSVQDGSSAVNERKLWQGPATGGDARGGRPAMAPVSMHAGLFKATPPSSSRRILEVEIDETVLWLLLVVCSFAFFPPMLCKLRQMLCSNQVADYSAEGD